MTFRVATIFRILLVLLCGYACQIKAQEKLTAPYKLDEFGPVGHCDMGARLDNFSISVSQTPGATAHIIAYGPDGPALEDVKQHFSSLSEYLIQIRGVK